MAKSMRWIAIAASLCIACGVQAATTAKPRARRVEERSAHATYRAARYARPSKPATSSSHTSHSSHGSKKTKTHHYVRHHYRGRRRYYRHRIRLPREPSRERITEIQTALGRGGYYKGDPNGRWDADTIAAVQKFQSANNMDATGKLDAPTLQKLGLGSDIAGVAAPRTVVPKMCCTTGAGAPTSGAPAVPAKPAGLTSPAPAVGHAQSGTTAPAAAQNAATTSATTTAAVAPAASTSNSGASDPATAASTGPASDPATAVKPAAKSAADQH